MDKLSSDCYKLLELVEKGSKLTAMLAPSFAVDFEEHQIVGGLKSLGFDHIVDHSLGIATVNKMYEDMMETNPEMTYITANCPSTVNLVVSKYNNIKNNLIPVFSPMVCMAKICKKTWPANLNVFIGPCLAKKEEARRYPKEIAVALTYKEVSDFFKFKEIDLSLFVDTEVGVEGFEDEVLKIFSTSGGVGQTLGISDEEVIIKDGVDSLSELFEKMRKGEIKKKVKLLDVLFCEGGCLGGPGIVSIDDVGSRKERLVKYLEKRGKKPLCSMVDTYQNG